jgi:hypothetical protein
MSIGDLVAHVRKVIGAVWCRLAHSEQHVLTADVTPDGKIAHPHHGRCMRCKREWQP